MKILVIGASGRLGSHLLPALLSYKHEPVAFVRNPGKLDTMLPRSLLERITVVQGDGEDIDGIVLALRENQCDGLICTAGSPGPVGAKAKKTLPYSRQGHISESVAKAARIYGAERQKAGRPILRGWWVTGIAFLPDPFDKGKIMHDRIPDFRPEHRLTDASVLPLPTSVVAWSILCPSAMYASPKSITYPSPSDARNAVHLLADTPRIPRPLWWIIRFFWAIPKLTIIGMVMMVFYRRFSYAQVADALAREFDDERYIGRKGGY